MAFFYIHAFSLSISYNYLTIFFLKQINSALGELVTTEVSTSHSIPNTHLLGKFLPYGFIILIIIIHSDAVAATLGPLPPSGIRSHEA